MAKLYRITPLEKKSVEYFVDVYQQLPNGRIRGFDVTETWRWGFGFREEDEPVYENEDPVHCRPDVGWGCDLDDLVAVHVEFGCWDMDGNVYDDGFTEEEKAEIEARLRYELDDEDGRAGTGWIYDGDHAWSVEDEHVAILGPYKVDLVDEDSYNEIVEENVELQKLTPSTDWPFPTEES